MRPSRSAAELIVGGNISRPSSGNGHLEKRVRPLSAGFSATHSKSQSGHAGGLPSLTRLEFGHACGDHGLYWDGTLVVKVAAQAMKLGVRPGWKIHMIDGHAVHDGNDIWMRLQEAKWQWRSCYVSFVTDTTFIRAERSMCRLAAIKAEEERKNLLPFEGNHDQKHLQQIAEEFTFQGYIERPEERAITYEQLQHLVRWSKDHCHRWRDPLPLEESRTSGMKLNLDFMTIFHLHHWLVKPATKDKACSMVELITGQKQTPAWCVIHWWGERVSDFMRCLECQVNVRSLPRSTSFWVSAFAIRPHLASDDSVDPVKTRFVRAVGAAQSRVLLMLDVKKEHSGPCTALNRLWCAYELASCADNPNITLDVVMVQGSKSALLMQGFNDEEQVLESRNPGSGFRAKTEREKAFSLEIVERSLDTKIQCAQATDHVDRTRVLNCLAGRELQLPPLEDHDSYHRANKRISALLALAFWRRVIVAAGNEAVSTRLQQRMADAIRNDVWRSSMDVCMAFCVANGPEEKLALLIKALPPNLRELRLDLSGLDIVNESMAPLAAALPRELEDLHLNLSHNPQIDNHGLTSFINALPPRQRGVNIALGNTSVSQEFQERRDSLDGLRQQIMYEAQKGSVCLTLNLSPSPSPERRMHVSTSRTKI